jgi:tetratricopeptide (TPR) repeat protein
MHVEHKNYDQAIKVFTKMLHVSQEINDPGLQALALMDIGSELIRLGNISEAIVNMEAARDITFRATKHESAVVNSYLARAYAVNHDINRFERAIDTAQVIAEILGDQYGDGTNNIYHQRENILSEQCNGYIELNMPKKALELLNTMTKNINPGNHTWTYANMPYHWARAHLLNGEIEASIEYGKLLIQRVSNLQSPHYINKAHTLLKEIKKAGYQDAKIVQEFESQLNDL